MVRIRVLTEFPDSLCVFDSDTFHCSPGFGVHITIRGFGQDDCLATTVHYYRDGELEYWLYGSETGQGGWQKHLPCLEDMR